MSELIDKREDKLPKWAQLELSRLRRRCEELARKLDEVSEAGLGAAVMWQDVYREHPIPIYGDRVYFTPDPDARDFIEVQYVEPGVVNVRSNWSALSIRPNVTNSIRVEVCK